MVTTVIAIFVCTFLIGYARGIDDYSDLPKGPYCAGRYPQFRCCKGRKDDCSAPILTTTCYCDDFCNSTHNNDCCPDYWSHCRGIVPLPGPEPVRRCYFKGLYYNEGSTAQDNCNKCKCSGVGEKVEMLCETSRCLVEPDIIEEVNRRGLGLSWEAENYTEFWGRSLADGIQLRLGTLNPSRSVAHLNPVRRLYNPDELPKKFDSQTKWEGFISEIRDQGWCAASWALSTVDVASDRYAIMSKGNESVQLAAQHLLSCNNRGQKGCQGGYLDRAWMFVRKYGLVNEGCYPWTGDNRECRLHKKTTLREARCRVPTNPPRTTLYKVGPSYRLGNETDIMQEILLSGPVQATMKVYQDFFVYKSGIYKHSPLAELHRTGYHSVRIVGWGEEFSTYGLYWVKYWVVANSWGKNWGENGFFRIIRGVNECEIETFVLAAWAKPKGIYN